MRGAAIIFFSYIGFDTASTTALESRRPQRDVPIGILGALVLSGVLYVAMAAVMTGMVPYTKLDVDQPVAVAIDMHPELGWIGTLVKVGVIAGMTSVVLMSLLGQPRILLAMADDGLLPGRLGHCHERYRTPHVATVVTGVFAAVFAGLFPLDVLGELISIGILLAFAVVCIGVLVLRRTRPDVHRPFRVPWAPVTCVVGALVCLAMTLALPTDTWWRLLVWSVAGFSIYAFYGYRHSRLRANSQRACAAASISAHRSWRPAVDIAKVNWLAVIVAAIAPFIVGSLWYGPLFMKPWSALTGITRGAPGQNSMALTFGTSAVLNLVIATSLAMFIGGGDWKLGLFAGFMSGFTFVAMAFGITYLFESRPFKLWLINAGYQTVVFTIMGAILGAWH
jgi:hypothetical protein